MCSVDEIQGRWKRQVGAAKIAWGKLTEDELLKAEGHQHKLAGLIQERYAITRDQADKQVKSSFEQRKTWRQDKHLPCRRCGPADRLDAHLRAVACVPGSSR